jgi:hypothetical protein
VVVGADDEHIFRDVGAVVRCAERFEVMNFGVAGTWSLVELLAADLAGMIVLLFQRVYCGSVT